MGALSPQWSTEQTLPWACKPGVTVKRVYCEQWRGGLDPKHSLSDPIPSEVIPRFVCRRLLNELKEEGLEFCVGGELEFTLSSQVEGQWLPYFSGCDIFATLQHNKCADYFYDIDRDMLDVGIDIKTLNAEYGEGQIEVTFAPKFGIEALDDIATFRTGAKELACNRGLRASFMARPYGVQGVGNGGHFNFSIWTGTGSDKISALHSESDPLGLSDTAKKFLAGILKHAPAMEAFCSPAPPCYTRHGHWAPTVANWGHEDRLAAVRVKSDPKGSPSNCYMEFRMPSAAANAYLVAACVVAAGLDGLRSGLELPKDRLDKDNGAVELPKNLSDALAALEADTYMTSKMGQDLVRWFCILKRAETAKINQQIAEETPTRGLDEATSRAWQHMYMEFI